MTGMGDSIAGPDVCSPDVYRRWALPYEREVVETLAAEGKRIGLHICGDTTRIVDDMVATGSLLLAVDYKTDRAEENAEIEKLAEAYAQQEAVYARAIQESLDLPHLPTTQLWFIWPDVLWEEPSTS